MKLIDRDIAVLKRIVESKRRDAQRNMSIRKNTEDTGGYSFYRGFVAGLIWLEEQVYLLESNDPQESLSTPPTVKPDSEPGIPSERIIPDVKVEPLDWLTGLLKNAGIGGNDDARIRIANRFLGAVKLAVLKEEMEWRYDHGEIEYALSGEEALRIHAAVMERRAQIDTEREDFNKMPGPTAPSGEKGGE